MMDGWFLEDFAPRPAVDAPTTAKPLEASSQQAFDPKDRATAANERRAAAQANAEAEARKAAAFAWVEAERRFRIPDIELPWMGAVEGYMRQLPARDFTTGKALVKEMWHYVSFMEWFLANHVQFVISPTPLTQQPAPPAPAAAPQHQVRVDDEEGWVDEGPAVPQPRRPRVSHLEAQKQHKRDELITGPDLAVLLGITPNSLNAWAVAHGVGAERDGWRLAGRGKLGAGRCSTYPPGCASWLFQKL